MLQPCSEEHRLNETKNKVQMHSAPVHKSNMISLQVQNKQTKHEKKII